MKALFICLFLLPFSLLKAQSTYICDCYNAINDAAADSEEFKACLKMHRAAVVSHNESAEEMFSSGNRDKELMKKWQEEEDKWKECFYPEVPEGMNKIEFSAKDT